VAERAQARINLAAIERNVARLRSGLTPGSAMCAVVKGDGYGHGAVPAARAAQAGGASWLAVATAGEAAELRAGGVDGPLLVMGALAVDELEVALTAGADVVAWSEEFVQTLVRSQAGRLRPDHDPARVHVKLDTGMGRLGTRDVAVAERVADAVLAAPGLELTGAMTHFATADDDLEFVQAQLAAFAPFAAGLRSQRPRLLVHAANSAATLRVPASHFDMVRCGIAIYGCDPMQEDPEPFGLEPALELISYVAAVKTARPGESAGYGRRFVAERETCLATVPVGYGDGVRRALTNNCDVLIGARRYPLVGTVSMDNITVDLGPSTTVRIGDRVTLIGADGRERQGAEEVARRLGTINYEVVCSISARVPRRYHRDGADER
jgi:alanine racemase